MARFKSISDAVLDSIKERMGSYMVRPKNALGAASGEMHETVDVWLLEANKVIGPTNDLRRLATNTGQLHHQVHFDNTPNFYARSQPIGAAANEWRITGIFQSELAHEIDSAISWIDESTPEDVLVRLLIVPVYQIHAFWLVPDVNEEVDQKIVVISAPQAFGFALLDHKYDASDFLSKLRKVDHTIGVIDR